MLGGWPIRKPTDGLNGHKFATCPMSWRPPGVDHFHLDNRSELSHMDLSYVILPCYYYDYDYDYYYFLLL